MLSAQIRYRIIWVMSKVRRVCKWDPESTESCSRSKLLSKTLDPADVFCHCVFNAPILPISCQPWFLVLIDQLHHRIVTLVQPHIIHPNHSIGNITVDSYLPVPAQVFACNPSSTQCILGADFLNRVHYSKSGWGSEHTNRLQGDTGWWT